MRGPGAAAVLSGLLLAAAAPPSPLPLLALGALAPFAAAVAALPQGRAGQRAAARGGALLFAVYWGLLLLWVLRLTPRVGWWPVPAYLGQVGLLAALGAGVGALLHRLCGRAALPLALALAWTAGEWVRGSLLGPLDFPWMGLAVPLTSFPPLTQGAAWVGERGLTLGVAVVNGALAASLLRRERGRAAWTRPALVAVVGLMAAWALGSFRLSRLAPQPVLRVAAVQPSVPLLSRGRVEGGSSADLDSVLRAIEEAWPTELSAGLSLVVLPETAVPMVLDGADAGPTRERVAEWSRRAGLPILIGAYGRAAEGRTNAAFLADADPAAPWPRTDKRRLVPGVEWFPGGRGLTRGVGLPVLAVDEATLGVLICIESVGPEPARRLRAAGVDALINLTNDAWLGEAPWWTRTAAFRQHPAHLRLRSIETGAGALRVGNNGLTTLVDPGGRQLLLLPPHRAGWAEATVESLPNVTVFVRTGDWAGPGSAALSALLVLMGIVGGARPRSR